MSSTLQLDEKALRAVVEDVLRNLGRLPGASAAAATPAPSAPAAAPTPELIPKASARGRATTPTVIPASIEYAIVSRISLESPKGLLLFYLLLFSLSGVSLVAWLVMRRFRGAPKL